MRFLIVRFLLAGLLLHALAGVELFPVSGQKNDQLVLMIESKIKLPSTGGGDYFQKAKAEAYLQADSDGEFSGTGEMSVSYSPQVYSQYSKISEVKGQGTFIVKGVKKGKNLRFWIEHGHIPLKGTITTSTPIGTEKKLYENTFDPASLAIGKLETQSGVVIELRDGASTEIIHQNRGKTFFTLYGVEFWRVNVVGQETDVLHPPIENPRLDRKLPIAMTFKWDLVGELTIAGKGGNRRYLNGNVFSAKVVPVFEFEHWDLYKCEMLDYCSGRKDPDVLLGESIPGNVTGGSVHLTWPGFFPVECVLCTPAKSYLGKVPYREKFGTIEFLSAVSKKALPLINGKVVRGGIQDWMRFTVTLTKIDG
ncbi:MAG: hypothetical protein GF421_00265 [Candidatus Aminicenantes bacterium]|nr:hypothetical protein [Candidatus Aminicenantes bacterium]